MSIRFEILEEMCVSHRPNRLGKNMNQCIFSQLRIKSILSLHQATNQGEKKSEFKPVIDHLKMELVWHTVRIIHLFGQEAKCNHYLRFRWCTQGDYKCIQLWYLTKVIDKPRRSGFNPRSSHTKDSKNGTWCYLG